MLFQGARSGLKMGSWLPADAVTPWSVRGRPLVGHWELRFGPFIVASSTRARFVTVPAAPAGNHLRFLDNNRREEAMLEQTRDAQLKLSVVASDIFGMSGRDMMAALIAGERSPQALAQLARSRMRGKIPQLEEAFVGQFTDHHGYLLTKMLARIDALSVDIADLDTKIEARLAPFADTVARLDEIPGVGAVTAAVIIAEVGLDMTRFPTPGISS